MTSGPNRKPAAKRPNVVPLHDHVLQRVVQEILSPPEGDNRPVLLFLAGPNGAGKTSLFLELDAQQADRKFPFINADLIAAMLEGIPGADSLAQKVADLAREHMLEQKASFATETVFSDEVGAKLDFLRRAEAAGFHVVLVYVTLANVHLSRHRVAFRVEEKMGHNVPTDKLQRRFLASRENCRRALYKVETAVIVDNSSAEIKGALRPMAVVKKGQIVFQAPGLPSYVQELLPLPAEGDADLQAKAGEK